MKKIFSLLLTLALFLALLTSCSTVRYTDVKRVTIEGDSYESFYLYSFEYADLSECQYNGITYPTETGYVYSTERLEIGDVIEVWGEHSFGYYDTNGHYTTRMGTTATVREITERYEIELLRAANSYTVTFFGLDGAAYGASSTVSEYTDAARAVKHKVEILTENPVYIEFNLENDD